MTTIPDETIARLLDEAATTRNEEFLLGQTTGYEWAEGAAYTDLRAIYTKALVDDPVITEDDPQDWLRQAIDWYGCELAGLELNTRQQVLGFIRGVVEFARATQKQGVQF